MPADFRQLPKDTQAKILEVQPDVGDGSALSEKSYRVITDYLAGMTDRYALQEHKRLFDPYERA